MPQAQVVSEAWLEACLAVQQRVLELDYLIIDQSKSHKPVACLLSVGCLVCMCLKRLMV